MTFHTATHSSSKISVPPGDTGIDVVTGAFSYSGREIACELQRRGRRLRTLTGHPHRGHDGIDVRLLDFDDLPGLVASLEGATTLYNTYWIRFPHGAVTHEIAAENSRALFYAAKRAGISRVVHISITHPSIESPYSYFRGKALVERHLAESGIPYSVLRPAILFGGDGVLINNIAWLLRRLPLFAVGGNGDYRVRPIHVSDLARLAIESAQYHADTVIDAVGPERPTFLQLVHSVRDAVGSQARIMRVPGVLLPILAAGLNVSLRDVLLTAEEYRAMSKGLADTSGPATGHIALSSWLSENREKLGINYANELDRHYRHGQKGRSILVSNSLTSN
jgi:NADH dehydrogenase